MSCTTHPEFAEYERVAPELARAADGAGFSPLRFHLYSKGGPIPYDGFLVEGTDGHLAIDERQKARGFEPARWFITHIPSGFRMDIFPDWHCSTREGAAARARRLYREWIALGFDMNSEEASEVVAQWNRLSVSDQLEFRRRVATP